MVGDWADIIVYDLDRLGFLYDRPRFDTEFPGGGRRLVQNPTGSRCIIVHLTITFQDKNFTEPLPGKLLRNYDLVG